MLGGEAELLDRTSCRFPDPIASHDDQILGVAGSDDLVGVSREDHLHLWSIANDLLEIADQTMLKLRVEVCLRFLKDHDSVENVRKERVVVHLASFVRLLH